MTGFLKKECTEFGMMTEGVMDGESGEDGKLTQEHKKR